MPPPPPPREGLHDHSIPRGAEAEAESSQARGHGSPLAPSEEENEAVHEGRIENEDPPYAPPRAEDRHGSRDLGISNRSLAV